VGVRGGGAGELGGVLEVEGAEVLGGGANGGGDGRVEAVDADDGVAGEEGEGLFLEIDEPDGGDSPEDGGAGEKERTGGAVAVGGEDDLGGAVTGEHGDELGERLQQDLRSGCGEDPGVVWQVVSGVGEGAASAAVF
jgi:hypothetical protein